jgi:hypothetical protein
MLYEIHQMLSHPRHTHVDAQQRLVLLDPKYMGPDLESKNTVPSPHHVPPSVPHYPSDGVADSSEVDADELNESIGGRSHTPGASQRP